jgi:hypothetical protein
MIDVTITTSGRTYPQRNERGKLIGDCVCRALTNYLDLPYAEVHEYLSETSNYHPFRGGVVGKNELINVMKGLGLRFVEKRVRINSATAVHKLPQKALLWFLIPSRGCGHLVHYEDGVIFDTFDTKRGDTTKQTYGYFIPA